MRPREMVAMSLTQFRTYPVRTLLTTVGVVVGVGAVVTFTTLGVGLEASITDTVIGDQQGVITASTTQQDPDEQLPVVGRGSSRVFTASDIQHLRGQQGVAEVIPLGQRNVAIEYTGQRYKQRAFVTPRSYFSLGRLEFVAGRPYRATDEVVLNRDAVALIEGQLAVGDQLVIGQGDSRRTVTVVGIVGSSNPLARLTGRSGAPRLYAPPSLVGPPTVSDPATGEAEPAYSWLFVRAEQGARVPAVRERVAGYLQGDSDARRLLGDRQRFDIASVGDWSQRVRTITSQLTTYVLAVGIASVAIGAVGIMNLLLVSVAERTRAIGVMRAVGATRRDVLGLFLTEAALIGLLGSLLGLITGLVAGYVGVQLLAFPFRLPVRWIVAGVTIGVVVSVLAGVYPARRAARLDPVEALRQE